MLYRLIICFVALLAICFPVAAQDIVEHVCSDRITFTNAEGSVTIPYAANRVFDSYNTDINRAVIVVHGTLRNAYEYFDSVMYSANASDNQDSLLVIAPQFLTEQDYQHWDLDDDLIFWTYMGWRQGDQSFDNLHYPRVMDLSAYAVADSIMCRLVQQNPNLRQIVVTGHSAGGQYVNRMMVASTTPDILLREHGVLVRGVVANPSSYVYLSPERLVEGTTYEFAIPDSADIFECYTFNDYKYGLQNPNPYMSGDVQLLADRYHSHEVVYLLGYLDNMWDMYLDLSCPADFQGEARRQRGTIYWEFLQDFYGPVITAKHNKYIVPGVGHDHTGMYMSIYGRRALFEFETMADPQWLWTNASNALISGNCGHSVTWIDYDDDDNIDLYIAGLGETNQLLRNLGNGEFSDQTGGPLSDPGDGLGSVWGDYDNDDDPDLYLVNSGSDNKLLRNDGAGVFVDVTDPLLAANGTVSDATWVDYDLDDDIDLYLACSDGIANILLRNDDGVFTDATTPQLAGTGDSQCAVWGDYDNDRDLDLFIANNGASRLLRNDGAGVFTDETTAVGSPNGDHRAAAWGDFNNDRLLDLFVAADSGTHALFFNCGAGEFRDCANLIPFTGSGLTGISLADYDNDGRLDILLAKTSANRLLFNPGCGRPFLDVSVEPVSDTADTRAAAWGDYDNDGDLDLFFANNGRSNRLVCNDGYGNNHFQVKLVGNSSSIGARVRVVTAVAEQIRQVGGDSGPLGRNSTVVSFGLGAAGQVDTLDVHWLSGEHVLRTDLLANQLLLVYEDSLDVPDDPGVPEVPEVFVLQQNMPNPFNPGTTILFEIPRAQSAELSIFSMTGQHITTLLNEVVEARMYDVEWDGRDAAGRTVASGVYFYRLRTEEFVQTRRMVLVR